MPVQTREEEKKESGEPFEEYEVDPSTTLGVLINKFNPDKYDQIINGSCLSVDCDIRDIAAFLSSQTTQRLLKDNALSKDVGILRFLFSLKSVRTLFNKTTDIIKVDNQEFINAIRVKPKNKQDRDFQSLLADYNTTLDDVFGRFPEYFRKARAIKPQVPGGLALVPALQPVIDLFGAPGIGKPINKDPKNRADFLKATYTNLEMNKFKQGFQYGLRGHLINGRNRRLTLDETIDLIEDGNALVGDYMIVMLSDQINLDDKYTECLKMLLKLIEKGEEGRKIPETTLKEKPELWNELRESLRKSVSKPFDISTVEVYDFKNNARLERIHSELISSSSHKPPLVEQGAYVTSTWLRDKISRLLVALSKEDAGESKDQQLHVLMKHYLERENSKLIAEVLAELWVDDPINPHALPKITDLNATGLMGNHQSQKQQSNGNLIPCNKLSVTVEIGGVTFPVYNLYQIEDKDSFPDDDDIIDFLFQYGNLSNLKRIKEWYNEVEKKSKDMSYSEIARLMFKKDLQRVQQLPNKLELLFKVCRYQPPTSFNTPITLDAIKRDAINSTKLNKATTFKDLTDPIRIAIKLLYDSVEWKPSQQDRSDEHEKETEGERDDEPARRVKKTNPKLEPLKLLTIEYETNKIKISDSTIILPDTEGYVDPLFDPLRYVIELLSSDTHQPIQLSEILTYITDRRFWGEIMRAYKQVTPDPKQTIVTQFQYNSYVLVRLIDLCQTTTGLNLLSINDSIGLPDDESFNYLHLPFGNYEESAFSILWAFNESFKALCGLIENKPNKAPKRDPIENIDQTPQKRMKALLVSNQDYDDQSNAKDLQMDIYNGNPSDDPTDDLPNSYISIDDDNLPSDPEDITTAIVPVGNGALVKQPLSSHTTTMVPVDNYDVLVNQREPTRQGMDTSSIPTDTPTNLSSTLVSVGNGVLFNKPNHQSSSSVPMNSKTSTTSSPDMRNPAPQRHNNSNPRSNNPIKSNLDPKDERIRLLELENGRLRQDLLESRLQNAALYSKLLEAQDGQTTDIQELKDNLAIAKTNLRLAKEGFEQSKLKLENEFNVRMNATYDQANIIFEQIKNQGDDALRNYVVGVQQAISSFREQVWIYTRVINPAAMKDNVIANIKTLYTHAQSINLVREKIASICAILSIEPTTDLTGDIDSVIQKIGDNITKTVELKTELDQVKTGAQINSSILAGLSRLCGVSADKLTTTIQGLVNQLQNTASTPISINPISDARIKSLEQQLAESQYQQGVIQNESNNQLMIKQAEITSLMQKQIKTSKEHEMKIQGMLDPYTLTLLINSIDLNTEATPIYHDIIKLIRGLVYDKNVELSNLKARRYYALKSQIAKDIGRMLEEYDLTRPPAITDGKSFVEDSDALVISDSIPGLKKEIIELKLKLIDPGKLKAAIEDIRNRKKSSLIDFTIMESIYKLVFEDNPELECLKQKETYDKLETKTGLEISYILIDIEKFIKDPINANPTSDIGQALKTSINTALNPVPVIVGSGALVVRNDSKSNQQLKSLESERLANLESENAGLFDDNNDYRATIEGLNNKMNVMIDPDKLKQDIQKIEQHEEPSNYKSIMDKVYALVYDRNPDILNLVEHKYDKLKSNKAKFIGLYLKDVGMIVNNALYASPQTNDGMNLKQVIESHLKDLKAITEAVDARTSEPPKGISGTTKDAISIILDVNAAFKLDDILKWNPTSEKCKKLKAKLAPRPQLIAPSSGDNNKLTLTQPQQTSVVLYTQPEEKLSDDVEEIIKSGSKAYVATELGRKLLNKLKLPDTPDVAYDSLVKYLATYDPLTHVLVKNKRDDASKTRTHFDEIAQKVQTAIKKKDEDNTKLTKLLRNATTSSAAATTNLLYTGNKDANTSLTQYAHAIPTAPLPSKQLIPSVTRDYGNRGTLVSSPQYTHKPTTPEKRMSLSENSTKPPLTTSVLARSNVTVEDDDDSDDDDTQHQTEESKYPHSSEDESYKNDTPPKLQYYDLPTDLKKLLTALRTDQLDTFVTRDQILRQIVEFLRVRKQQKRYSSSTLQSILFASSIPKK
jgi:hypothetical protein